MDAIRIEYDSGILDYGCVRDGILQFRDGLTLMGYRCYWNEPDPNIRANPEELRERGYSRLGDALITRFEKDGLPFTVSMFPANRTAQIHGDNSICRSDLDRVGADLERLAEMTGIRLQLNQVF